MAVDPPFRYVTWFHMMRTSRRRLKQISDRAISFELADSTRAEPSGAYDAIFCMAVLREPDCPDTVFRKTGK